MKYIFIFSFVVFQFGFTSAQSGEVYSLIDSVLCNYFGETISGSEIFVVTDSIIFHPNKTYDSSIRKIDNDQRIRKKKKYWLISLVALTKDFEDSCDHKHIKCKVISRLPKEEEVYKEEIWQFCYADCGWVILISVEGGPAPEFIYRREK